MKKITPIEIKEIFQEKPQTEAEYKKNGKVEYSIEHILTFSIKDIDMPFGDGTLLIITKDKEAFVIKKNSCRGYHLSEGWTKIKVFRQYDKNDSYYSI